MNISKKISIVCLAGLVSGLLLSSCDPNEKDLGDNMNINFTQVNVKVVAKNHGSSHTAGGLASADSVSFGEASMGVAWLHFQPKDTVESDSTESDSTDVSDSTDMDDDSDSGAKLEGPFKFDLVAGTSTPDFDATSGPYEGVVVKLAPILDGGNSLFATFDMTKDTVTTKVEFSSNTKRAFVIRGDSALQIDGSSDQVLVVLQIDKLFAGIDFSKAKADEDGVIRINEKSNKQLHNKINSNLAKAFKAGKDNDDDGDIDE